MPRSFRNSLKVEPGAVVIRPHLQAITLSDAFVTFPTFHSSSVIRQKGESQNGCFKKTKQVEFSEKRTFFTP